VAALGALLRQSLLTAREEPGLVAPLVRLFAREIDQQVIDAHIKAYVGELSLDMGELGRAALTRLAGLAEAGK
jgi:1,4-dihydroxy-6-naphthoate synthase